MAGESSSNQQKFSSSSESLQELLAMYIASGSSGFSIRRMIFLFGLKQAVKKHQIDRVEYFTARLDALNECKTNVMVKYIAKELFIYFFISFLLFFVIFFVNSILVLAKEILGKHAPVGATLKIMVYSLPAIVAQSAPFATLVGFLMCLGRMGSDNEILIIRASGLRYGIMLIPVLVMGLLISVFSFIMNDYFLPLGKINYNRLLRQIKQSNPTVEIESNTVKKLTNSTIVIGEVNDDTVSSMVLFENGSDSMKIIIANDCKVTNTQSAGVMMDIVMQKPTVLLIDQKDKKNFDVLKSEKLSMNIFENAFIGTSNGTSPGEMTSLDLYRYIRNMKKSAMETKLRLNSYNLEMNKKFYIPFASVFFSMLAFPLALIFARKGGQTLGLIAGVIISVFYWAVTLVGQIYGLEGGFLGYLFMWGPDCLIGILGIILYMRLRRK